MVGGISVSYDLTRYCDSSCVTLNFLDNNFGFIYCFERYETRFRTLSYMVFKYDVGWCLDCVSSQFFSAVQQVNDVTRGIRRTSDFLLF